VDDEARRLVDREEVLVLVEHVERNVLGVDRDGTRLGDFDLDGIAPAHNVRALRRLARNPSRSLLDEPLDPGSGKVRADGSEIHIQSRARGRLPHLETTNHRILNFGF
jgi:hypothetical protein